MRAQTKARRSTIVDNTVECNDLLIAIIVSVVGLLTETDSAAIGVL